MVAYSFASPFRDQVATLTKRQTIRGDRRRHARPGEPVQLFAAMRTRACVKLVASDPICTTVVPIEISTSVLIDELLAEVVINGMPLHRDEIEAFAAADGFGVDAFGDVRWRTAGRKGTARYNMGDWWGEKHGYGRFSGWLIRWEPRA